MGTADSFNDWVGLVSPFDPLSVAADPFNDQIVVNPGVDLGFGESISS